MACNNHHHHHHHHSNKSCGQLSPDMRTYPRPHSLVGPASPILGSSHSHTIIIVVNINLIHHQDFFSFDKTNTLIKSSVGVFIMHTLQMAEYLWEICHNWVPQKNCQSDLNPNYCPCEDILVCEIEMFEIKCSLWFHCPKLTRIVWFQNLVFSVTIFSFWHIS